MNRALLLLVAVTCYAAFFLSFVYLVGFVAGYPALPTHVDKGIDAAPAMAVIVDVLLIALFGVQHSVMARPAFKARWMRIVPPAVERSVFCLATAAVLAVLFVFWHPVGGTLWHVRDPLGAGILWGLFAAGFGIVFISTWLINHFELFGLAQAWSHFRGHEPQPLAFRTPLFYRLVRHPIYLGFLLAFWATPHMSLGHLLLAAGFTVYILIGIRYEERDLMVHFGNTYGEYRARVGMVLPWLGRG
jgi:protein-S-isoprenylcysteine O-methyltransferase Ste14